MMLVILSCYYFINIIRPINFLHVCFVPNTIKCHTCELTFTPSVTFCSQHSPHCTDEKSRGSEHCRASPKASEHL